MSSKFDMKDLDADRFILGMEINRDQAGSKIWLNQSKYVGIVLKHLNM